MQLQNAIKVVAEGPASDVNLIGVAAAAGLSLLVSWLVRRRRPAGLSAGLFVAAISGAAVLTMIADLEGGARRIVIGHTATVLCVVWFFASRARQSAAQSGGSLAFDRSVPQAPFDSAGGGFAGVDSRSVVFEFAATVCGLAAVAVALSLPREATTWGRYSAMADLMALAAVVFLTGRPGWSRNRNGTKSVTGSGERPADLVPIEAGRPGLSWRSYAGIALLAGGVSIWLPTVPLETKRSAIPASLTSAGFGSLAVFLGVVLWNWRRRVRRWLHDPQRLAEHRPESDVLFRLLVVISVCVGVVACLFADSATAAVSALAACLTCLGIGHASSSRVVSETGLILLGISLVTAGHWLASDGTGALSGLALCGCYFLWLGRFWEQQLWQGRAWTTAGRLIPTVRRLGRAAAAAAALVAGACLNYDGAGLIRMSSLSATALLILLSLRLARDAVDHQDRRSAFASCLAIVAATVPLAWVLKEVVAPLPAASLLGFTALVLAVRIPGREPVFVAPVYTAFFGGAIPVTLLLGMAVAGTYASLGGGFACAAAALAALAFRLRTAAVARRVADLTAP